MSIKIRKNLETLVPYPPGKPIEDVEREFNLTRVIKLASNENPLGPSPKALESIKKHLNEINLYPDGNAYYLKNDIAEKLGVPLENIILGNGSDEIIALTGQTFLDKDDEIIISERAFVRYQMAAQIQDAKWVSVPMIQFRHNFKGFISAISEKTKIIFFSNPTNPFGTMVTAKEVEYLLAYVPKHILIVMDEAYTEYIDDPQYPKSLNYLKEYDNLLVLRTFSKAYGLAGLRIGYGIGHPEIINGIDRVRPPFNVNRLAQEAARAALNDTEHIEKSKKLNREGLQYLYRELDMLGVTYIPSYANFIMIDTGFNCMQVFDKLQRVGVIVRPMKGYGLPNNIRVTVGTMEENQIFVEAFAKVLKELKGE